MPLEPGSVKLGLSCDLKNPECTRAELEPFLDQAFETIKSEIFAKIENQAGGGGTCEPHDKVCGFEKATSINDKP